MIARFSWTCALVALAVSPLAAQEVTQWRATAPRRALVTREVEPTAARQSPAIVRIWARQSNSASGGSGTLVAKDEDGRGLIVTNRHVISDGGRIEVHWPTGEQTAGTVEAIGGGNDDLAAVFTDVPDGIEPLPVRDDEPAADETLWMAGYGGSSERFAYGPGSYRAVDDVNAEIHGTYARHGDSGGPIVDADGQVAGVLWGSTGFSGGNETVLIRLPRLRIFLERVGRLCKFAVGPCASCGGGGSMSSHMSRPSAPHVLDGDDDFASDEPGLPYEDDEPQPAPKPKSDHVAELEKQLDTLGKRLAELEKLKATPGPPGPAGPAGPPGPAGEGAQLDIARLEKIEQRIVQHESAIADAIDLASRRAEIAPEEIERIASAVQKKLAGSIRLKVESVPRGNAHAMLNPD
jgi:hypothetical protein